MKDSLVVIDNAYGYAGTEKACNFLCSVLSDVSNVDILSFNGSGEPFYPYESVRKIINMSGVSNKYFHAMKLIRGGKYENIFIISMGRMSVFIALFYFFLIKKEVKRNIKLYSCEHVSIHSFPNYIKFLKKITCKIYNSIVVLTERDKEVYDTWGARAVTIANPIKSVLFERNKINKTMLAIGRLTKQKGFDRLLKIWSVYYGINPGWKLLIAGDGEEKESLNKLAKDLNITGSVKFLGKVKDTDELYKCSDILLMSSHYEGLPMVLLEAQTWGLPTVVYDCPTGPKEIIINGYNGYLVSDGSKEQFVESMLELSNNETLYYSMVENIKEINPNFREDLISQKWKSLAIDKS